MKGEYKPVFKTVISMQELASSSAELSCMAGILVHGNCIFQSGSDQLQRTLLEHYEL
jgi:hypothetical protein